MSTWFNKIKDTFSIKNTTVENNEEVIKTKILENNICIIGMDISYKVRVKTKIS